MARPHLARPQPPTEIGRPGTAVRCPGKYCTPHMLSAAAEMEVIAECQSAH